MRLASRKPVEVAPTRIGPLSKLPVFLELSGKRVVVAGGSAQAVWKAELVAAAGAHVEVYATQPGDEMAELLERGAAAGSFVHHARQWDHDIFTDAALALCAAEDDTEAKAFFDAARTAGVLVNVIDRPAFCQFQLGSIVNRSPIVIGIATDGAAPILAQAIRRRIETLLPIALATWGAIAKRVRASVNAQLPFGARRRAFWEHFAERALTDPPSPDAEQDTRRLVKEMANEAKLSSGRVTLVGAGPGDAELMTIKALRALQSADVILFDDLVSADVLELGRREAKRICVGKRGRRASCAQSDINELMVDLASQGKHVVRLKSGDPMIFGRAGEEIARLEAAGIPVDVVPGITAGLALGSALGVSLTHRDHAHSVRFVAGHARHGELSSELDWQGLADPQTTLIFYMAGRTAPAIAGRLIEHAMPPGTPVVLAAGIGQRNAWRWCGRLSDLDRCPPAPDGMPVLLAIGQALAPALTSHATSATTRRAIAPAGPPKISARPVELIAN